MNTSSMVKRNSIHPIPHFRCLKNGNTLSPLIEKLPVNNACLSFFLSIIMNCLLATGDADWFNSNRFPFLLELLPLAIFVYIYILCFVCVLFCGAFVRFFISVYMATTPDLRETKELGSPGVGGLYMSDCKPAPINPAVA